MILLIGVASTKLGSNVLLTPVNTTLLQELCTGSAKIDAYSPAMS